MGEISATFARKQLFDYLTTYIPVGKTKPMTRQEAEAFIKKENIMPVKDYDPKMCCSGHECGCMGMPTEPCICSEECWKALMEGIGKDFEQRRIDAGIELCSS
jgi:hypothetical protein